jgi:hypothetical protein
MVLAPLLLLLSCAARSPLSPHSPHAGAGAGRGDELAPAASLRVEAGRATLVQGEQIVILTRGAAARSVRGQATLEIGAGGEVELSFPGSASLWLEGPALLEWDWSERASERPHVWLERLRALELEVRRGELLLDLPHGFLAHVGRAALRVEESAGEVLVLRHHGGDEIAIASRVPRPAGWPRRLIAGEIARLRGARRAAP